MGNYIDKKDRETVQCKSISKLAAAMVKLVDTLA